MHIRTTCMPYIGIFPPYTHPLPPPFPPHLSELEKKGKAIHNFYFSIKSYVVVLSDIPWQSDSSAYRNICRHGELINIISIGRRKRLI